MIDNKFKEEDGTIDWYKLIIGKDKKKALGYLIFFLALMMMAYGYYHDTQVIREIQDNPCVYVVRDHSCNTNTTLMPINNSEYNNEKRRKEKEDTSFTQNSSS